MVHLESGRLGLAGVPKADLPSPLGALRARWYLILPLIALVWLLFSGYTPLFAGTVGLGLTALIILGVSLAGTKTLPLRVLFWIALGLLSAAGFSTSLRVFGFEIRGVTAILGLTVVLILINFLFRGGRATLQLCLSSLAEGARNALPVGIACALVGVIIGSLVLTGSATTFARLVVSVGENSLFLSLLLTMVACLVLGMGIPTIPNYIITSSIAGPALLDLGVPLIVSHMFVFYFGIMADLTPPVALAAFAAAPIAKESGMKIGIQAVRIAVAGFVVPFMAVYSPMIMLQDGGPLAEGIGFWPAVAYTVTKAVIAIVLWGAVAVGWMDDRLAWWERLWAFGAAALLITALPVTDEAGFVASAVFLVWRWNAARRRPVEMSAP